MDVQKGMIVENDQLFQLKFSKSYQQLTNELIWF